MTHTLRVIRGGRRLDNWVMQQEVDAGKTIDLSRNERTADGSYILAQFIDGKDYCDSKIER